MENQDALEIARKEIEFLREALRSAERQAEFFEKECRRLREEIINVAGALKAGVKNG